jgi:hypothetical protein
MFRHSLCHPQGCRREFTVFKCASNSLSQHKFTITEYHLYIQYYIFNMWLSHPALLIFLDCINWSVFVVATEFVILGSFHKFCVWFYCNNKILDKYYWYSWMFTHMSSTQCKHQHCPHTFPIYVVNDKLQLCIRPCTDALKRQWQQCWYRLPIQIVFPEFTSLSARCTFFIIGLFIIPLRYNILHRYLIPRGALFGLQWPSCMWLGSIHIIIEAS